MNVGNNFIAKPDNAFHTLYVAVNSRCLLKFHGFAGMFARSGQYAGHMPPVGNEEFRNAAHFGSIFFRSYRKLAGAHTLIHFAINATGMVFAGYEAVGTTA
jgi:hypothetical protein